MGTGILVRSRRTAGRVCRRSGVVGGVVGLLILASFVAASPAQASYDGSNGLVAFVADSGNGVQLYTVRSNGHGLRQITQLSGDAVAPDWSPDGRTIVFEHDLPGDEGATVELVNADGRDRTTLVQDPGIFSGAPSFTPDGSGIVFARFDPATNVEDIWSLDLASGNRREITAGNGFGASAPEVSPDGRTLSFVAGNPTDVGFGLYTCAMDGSHLRQLVPVSADLVDKQDWAPDGRRLAASDNHDHTAPGVSENVFSVRPDGTHLTYLTHFAGGDLNAVMGSYSPDGEWIAFRLEDHGQYALYRMQNDGGSPHPILPLSSLKPRYIDWGPSETSR
jgi:Tol biopolymer transport system component